MRKPVLVAALLTISACALPAAAQASEPPTLSGETLSASPILDAPPYPFFLGQCGSASPGGPAPGPDFSFTGTASGPYPGMFTESGTTTYAGYQGPPSNYGPVTSYSAKFRIISHSVTITGRETMVRNGAQAECDDGAGGSGVIVGPVTTRYRATIVTLGHRGHRTVYHDYGTTQATVGDSLRSGGYWYGNLSDQFTSRRNGH